MNEPEKELLERWFTRSNIIHIAHYRTASWLEHLHYAVGLPTVIFSTIIGSSIFATISDGGSSYYGLRFATGVLSIIAACLGGAQTFLRLGERASMHREAGVLYSSLKREIEQALVFPPDDLRAYINSIRERWDKLNSECPTVPTKIFLEAEKTFKKSGQALASSASTSP